MNKFFQRLIRDGGRDDCLVEQLADRLATMIFEVHTITFLLTPVGRKDWRVSDGEVGRHINPQPVRFSEDLTMVAIGQSGPDMWGSSAHDRHQSGSSRVPAEFLKAVTYRAPW